MKKKRVLFMTHSLPIGGIEAALLAMLRAIDSTRYEIDLLLVNSKGERMNEVPEFVTIRELPEKEKIYFERIGYTIKKLKSGKYFIISMKRIYYTIKLLVCRILHIEYDIWKDFLENIGPLEKQYDVAIDYDGFCNRYILKKVKANIKMMWNHFDYDFFTSDYINDKKYFSEFHYIVTISELCAEKLKKYFGDISSKIIIMHNLIDIQKVKELSEIHPGDIPGLGSSLLKICSTGRLNKQKDFALSIEVAFCLKTAGINFVWYIIGEGIERVGLEKMIKEKELQEQVILLGKRENPYPYMKACDIYVQNSLFEGLCIAVSEAKILCRPIIVADVLGLKDQIKSGENGIIAKREKVALANAIIGLDKDKRRAFSENLSKELYDNNESIQIFYQICESESEI